MKHAEAELKPEVTSIRADVGAAVTDADVDSYARITDIQDKSSRLRALVQAWEKQQREERKMRKDYAERMLWGLVGQGLLVNLAFFGIGFGWLEIEKWVATSFILAVLAEISGMTLLILRYLFPKESTDLLATIQKL